MLFERAGCPVSCGGSDWGVQAHFEALLSDPVVRAQVCVQELARSRAIRTARTPQPGSVSVLVCAACVLSCLLLGPARCPASTAATSTWSPPTASAASAAWCALQSPDTLPRLPRCSAASSPATDTVRRPPLWTSRLQVQRLEQVQRARPGPRRCRRRWTRRCMRARTRAPAAASPPPSSATAWRRRPRPARSRPCGSAGRCTACVCPARPHGRPAAPPAHRRPRPHRPRLCSVRAPAERSSRPRMAQLART